MPPIQQGAIRIDTQTPGPGATFRGDGAGHTPTMPRLTARRALLRIGVVTAIAAAVLIAGAANGVGPLDRVTPPSQVTDPREMLARSLQSVIDASSVHVEVTLTGRVPGALVGRSDAVVDLAGTRTSLDLRPQDARSHLEFSSPDLGLQLEAVTSWDAVAYRSAAGTWSQGSLGSVLASSGIDANPLTLVDRLRAWLAAPGAPAPTATDVACDGPSGLCRRVALSLGPEAGDILLNLLRAGGAAQIGATTTDVVLLADAATLQPVHVTLAVRSADASLAATVLIDTAYWNSPSVIPDPPGG